jgi:hypothetical protein
MMQLEKLCRLKEHFKKELKIEEQFKPTTIFCHNQSALKLVKNPQNTKQIELQHHFIREKAEQRHLWKLDLFQHQKRRQIS